MKVYYLFFFLLAGYLLQATPDYVAIIRAGKFRTTIKKAPSMLGFDLLIFLGFIGNIFMGLREQAGLNDEHFSSMVIWFTAAGLAVHRLTADVDAIRAKANAKNSEVTK
jgi:hypothetical protein